MGGAKNEKPEKPDFKIIFYAGFNATEPNTMPISVGVHHPGGDPKKINYDSGYATSSYWSATEPHTHWFFLWDVLMMVPP